MDSKILCHDDFLSTSDFLMLQNCILGSSNENRFPWTWGAVDPPYEVEKSDLKEIDNHQLFHWVYFQDMYVSTPDICQKVMPIMANKVIDVRSLIKIKINCNTRTSNIVEHMFHTDVENYDSKTGILYVNTCNGYTEFENGTKVESKANRFIEFDSKLKHRGTTCTDEKRRVVINLNYF